MFYPKFAAPPQPELPPVAGFDRRQEECFEILSVKSFPDFKQVLTQGTGDLSATPNYLNDKNKQRYLELSEFCINAVEQNKVPLFQLSNEAWGEWKSLAACMSGNVPHECMRRDIAETKVTEGVWGNKNKKEISSISFGLLKLTGAIDLDKKLVAECYGHKEDDFYCRVYAPETTNPHMDGDIRKWLSVLEGDQTIICQLKSMLSPLVKGNSYSARFETPDDIECTFATPMQSIVYIPPLRVHYTPDCPNVYLRDVFMAQTIRPNTGWAADGSLKPASALNGWPGGVKKAIQAT